MKKGFGVSMPKLSFEQKRIHTNIKSMIKRFLTQFTKNCLLTMLALCFTASVAISQTASYKCLCADGLPVGVFSFELTVTGDDPDYVLANSSGIFSSFNPQVRIPNGTVLTLKAGTTNQYVLSGFAVSGDIPSVTISDASPITPDLSAELVSCILPTAEIATANVDVCVGERIRLNLMVDALQIDNSSIVYTSSGGPSLMPFANNLSVFAVYPAQGSFTLTATGETNAGCAFNANIVINATDISDDYEIQGEEYICLGNATDVPYTINNPNDLALLWNSKPSGALFTPGTGSGSMMAMTGSGTAVEVTFPTAGDYTLCVTNGNPNSCALTNVEKFVRIVEAIDTVQILGECYICLGETGSYSISNPTDFVIDSWSVLPTAGTTMTPANGMSDGIDIQFDQTGMYVVEVRGTHVDGCDFVSTLEVEVPSTVGSLACNNIVNVSLNNDCALELLPDMILEGNDNKPGAYTLEITDITTGEVLTTNMITQDQLGHEFTVTVIEKCGGNSCWGNIVVEDKSITPLSPFCADDFVNTTCHTFDDIDNLPGFPDFPADVTVTYQPGTEDYLLEGFDNCSDAILSYEDDNISTNPCQDPQVIIRTWTAVDVTNGASSQCEVTILVDLVDLTSIMWPPNFDSTLDSDPIGAMDTDNTFQSLNACPEDRTPHANLFCDNDGIWTRDEDGNPSPDCTGRPTGLLCTNLQVIGYVDEVLPICKGSMKILRKWTVWDECANQDFMHTQIITVMDNDIPICTAPTEGVRFTDTHECGATIFIDAPLVLGECNGFTYTIKYKLRDNNGIIPSQFIDTGVEFDATEGLYKINDLAFDSDTVWVQYIVRDACGNVNDECFNEYELVDDEQPIPACDLFNSVSLNDTGMTFAGPGSFDDNSWDNCGINQTVIQRMDIGDCDCQEANYDFMHSLGEYNGHYYYLSKDKKVASKAFALSEALDGYTAVINDAAEDAWLKAQAATFGIDTYIIGLSGVSFSNTSLNWTNGSASTYRNWATNEPFNDLTFAKGDVHVFVDSDGNWNAERRTQVNDYYIVEREERCGWSQKVKFCCSDVGENPMVAVRVIDNFGNHNFCMVNVNVIDIVGPTITCPTDRTINCDEDFDPTSNLSQYGTATATDQCSATVVELDPSLIMRDCGEGTLTRTFTATDAGGTTAECTQIITLRNNSPFSLSNIRFPKDIDLEDDYCTLRDIDPSITGEPILTNKTCSNATFTFDDQLFLIVDGVCQKLVRTWIVVDWCQPEEIWTHNQIIKLINEVGPEFTDATCANESVDGELVGICEVQVDGVIGELKDVNMNCAENAKWSYTIDFENNGSIDRTGNTNDASGIYPYGTHKITWTVRDDCKNESTCIKLLTVNDNKPPTPYCHTEIIIPISDTLGVEIWASDLDLGAYDDCPTNDIFLSFSENTLVTNLTLDCDDLNPNSNLGTVEVDLYVWDNDNASIANKAYCTVTILVQDNDNICDNIGTGAQVATISGNVITEEFELVDLVEMALIDTDGPHNNMASLGVYAFDDVNMYKDYEVKAFKDDNYLNGVSTLDLVVIQRHILGIEPLNSPYKMIAADADNSETISAIDLIELRKLILGIYETLPSNYSWRFVEEDFNFIDPSNPWPFSELVEVSDLDADILDANFMGVKIGDVNNSAIANLLDTDTESRNANIFEIELKEIPTDRGNTRVQLIAKQTAEILGMQCDLKFDDYSTELLTSVPMAIDFSQDNISWDALGQGRFKMSWHGVNPKVIQSGDVLIELLFSGKESAVELSTYQKGLKTEIYTLENNQVSINRIAFDDALANTDFDFDVRQNSPNPFKDKTQIEFTLPQSSEVSMIVTDQTGRVVYRQNGKYEIGQNTIEISADALGATGILYYQLATETHTSTKKMIVLQ